MTNLVPTQWNVPAPAGPNTPVMSQETPQLVELGPGLVGVAFSVMKLIPARYILQQAWAEGRVEQGTRVVESTSGTFGLALALVCSQWELPLTLVSDPAMDPHTARRLADLGVDVEVIDSPDAGGGFQKGRLARLAAIREKDPYAFWPQQYDNPSNPTSYYSLAAHVYRSLGPIDTLVGPVGSGGSMCGTGRFLRQVVPELHLVGVDTHRSVLFGQPDGTRTLRGLGNSIIPGSLDHTQFDEVHWVPAPDGFAATRDLHRRKALFMGPTSGAAWMVAQWVGAQRGGTTVVLLPDEGHRYATTVYDDAWLALQGGGPGRKRADSPDTVPSPRQADGSCWERLVWGRRTLDFWSQR